MSDNKWKLRLKYISWIITGVYVSFLIILNIFDPWKYSDIEGLILLPIIPLGAVVLLTTLPLKGE